ncbi:Beta-lactamase class A [Streptomyces sp. KS_5]|nr:Beta-lactamase class A [Streptomyces sp. PAN_FS17]SED28236.1 Beta-lactamase class A [Streptomyces sp. KS_5]
MPYLAVGCEISKESAKESAEERPSAHLGGSGGTRRSRCPEPHGSRGNILTVYQVPFAYNLSRGLTSLGGMTHGREKSRGVSRRVRAVVAAGVGAGVFIPVIAAGPAAAAAPTVSCTSAKAGLADKLKKDITAALANRKGTIAVGLYDRSTNTNCSLRASSAYDSASVVKVTVLATLLWDAKKHNRYLTDREATLSKDMITKSDNAATSTLWKQLGLTKIKGFLAAAGMTQTKPGANGYWGLTQITVTDEQKLLKLITAKNTVLSDNARAYILKLMGQVVSSQRWGTPYGVPSGVSVAVKNGWLSRSTHGWRVHSVGAFKGGGHDYMITVLTHDNSTMNYGIATIQGVAKAIHKDLAAS